jgi:hypothetical protein
MKEDVYILLLAVAWVTIPTLLALFLAWPLLRQGKAAAGLFLGVLLIAGFVLLGWLYTNFGIQGCIKSCLGTNSPYHSCEISCRLAYQPGFNAMLVLSFFSGLIFLLAGGAIAVHPRAPFDTGNGDRRPG